MGGLLIEEFTIVKGGKEHGRRAVDGLIVLGEKNKRMTPGSKADITGKDVVIIQTKNSRLGMSLMGQTLFSAKLIRRLKPCSVKSVTLCASDDIILRPMLKAFKGCEVAVCPAKVYQKTRQRKL